mgnify:CR=1 FL=1
MYPKVSEWMVTTPTLGDIEGSPLICGHRFICQMVETARGEDHITCLCGEKTPLEGFPVDQLEIAGPATRAEAVQALRDLTRNLRRELERLEMRRTLLQRTYREALADIGLPVFEPEESRNRSEIRA